MVSLCASLVTYFFCCAYIVIYRGISTNGCSHSTVLGSIPRSSNSVTGFFYEKFLSKPCSLDLFPVSCNRLIPYYMRLKPNRKNVGVLFIKYTSAYIFRISVIFTTTLYFLALRAIAGAGGVFSQ